jgi:MFS family permease
VSPQKIPFYSLLVANGVSWLGSAISQIAIPWFVLFSTGSPALTGLVALFAQLGTLLSLLLSAFVVDALGSRRAALLADFGSASAVALLPLLSHFGKLPFWGILALTGLRALFDGPNHTAKASLLPDLAGRAGLRLERANTLSELMESGAGWIGPLVAGVLIAALGKLEVLWFDAASFLLSGLLLLWLVPHQSTVPLTAQPRGDPWAGWRFLLSDPPLRAIFVSSLALSAAMSALFTVVLPVLTRGSGGDASGLGATVAGFGAGSVLGALGFGRFGLAWSQRRTFIVGICGLWGIFAALSFAPSAPLMIAVCFAGGLIAGPNGPLISTILQERTPSDLRARVFAASSTLSLGASPLGVLLVGIGLERLGAPTTLQIVATVVGVSVAAVMLDRRWQDTGVTPHLG